jgi:hypothetical protein
LLLVVAVVVMQLMTKRQVHTLAVVVVRVVS